MSEQLVKRFVAPTMTRALELVQREMGPEAVILSSQRTADGVEIITSLEPDLPTRGIDVRREFGRNFDAEFDTVLPSDSAWRSQAGIEQAAAQYGGRREANGQHQFSSKSSAELASEIEAAREKMLAAKRRAQQESHSPLRGRESERAAKRGYAGQSATQMNERPEQAPGQETYGAAGHRSSQRSVPSTHSPHDRDHASVNSLPELNDQHRLETLQNEIADMRMLLEQQLWRLTDRPSQISGVSMPQQVNMPSQFSVLPDRLRRLGLHDALVEELAATAGHQTSTSAAWRLCMAELSKRIPVCEQNITDVAGTYAFLGQTGVGKTTTIAKLAAQYVLKHGPGKVALVTTDTYRVGAFDQLRTMGRILSVPVKVVDQENSLLTVLSSLRQFPLILIDTAGFRIGDPLLRAQLDQLESSPSIKRVLVLSCNSQMATMKAAIHAHRGNKGIAAAILTKIDESASIGEAISVVVQAQLPVAYLTDGQDIPQDISTASGHGLVSKAVALLKAQAATAQAATI